MNDTDAHNIGGHLVIADGTLKGMPRGDQTVYKCGDCDERDTRIGLSVGWPGCPGRPESLTERHLSVCGAECDGHPDTNTAQWRAYRDSDHLSITTVPRWHHTVDGLTERAAAQFLYQTKRVHMKITNWEVAATPVEYLGGVVASFDHVKGHYDVVVNQYGKITVVRRGDV